MCAKYNTVFGFDLMVDFTERGPIELNHVLLICAEMVNVFCISASNFSIGPSSRARMAELNPVQQEEGVQPPCQMHGIVFKQAVFQDEFMQ